jgi:outer membrane PBP1 activator LpoA protein
MRENVGRLRLLRMTQDLSLTEAQTARIYPLFNRLEREKTALQRDLAVQLQQLRMQLRDLPAAETSPDPARTDRLAKLILNIRDIRRSIRDKDDVLDEFLEKELDPVQKARYILFQIEFNQGLGNALDRVRNRRLVPPAQIKK